LRQLCFIIILFCFRISFAQDAPYKSIHREEVEYHREYEDEIYAVQQKSLPDISPGCTLEKIVFGYHPYWMGNAYLNYQWHLLSDLCYFSYEVDPATGAPVTIHNWLTDPVIDSAQANDIRTHLCATLFSGHATFFSNPASMQTLIDSLITFVQMRNADGINLDFEAVPAAYGEEMVDFVIDLAQQYHVVDPDGIVSMAMPAVDWSGIFNVALLNDHIGIFFIMGYDYYWNGSSQAGPVAPLYSMTSMYNYNLSRTTSYYQSEGVPNEKLVIGMPYYAREWPTQGGIAPSNATGSGTAYKYSTIKNWSGGNYSPENRRWEQHSFSTYYAFQENNSLYQCFLCETSDLNYRYEIINQRGLGGIGIWALGYDDGYSELWQLIADRFTDCAIPLCIDTIYDSGGPYWNYYHDEDYTITLQSCDDTQVILSFESFSLESGYDSLWIFDGPDTTSPEIGAFSGNDLPARIISTGNELTLLFISDVGITMPGWMAVWESGFVSIEDEPFSEHASLLFPNPAHTILNVSLPTEVSVKMSTLSEYFELVVYDMNGRKMEEIQIPGGKNRREIDVTGYPDGVYIMIFRDGPGNYIKEKFVIAR